MDHPTLNLLATLMHQLHHTGDLHLAQTLIRLVTGDLQETATYTVKVLQMPPDQLLDLILMELRNSSSAGGGAQPLWGDCTGWCWGKVI